MKIISRYILTEFLKSLLFTCLVFIGLYIIARLVDDMRLFVEFRPSFSIILLFYFFQAPYFFVQILPLAILLSSLFSLGQLGRTNELVAMRSCGIRFTQIAFPILWVALALVGVVMLFNEIVIPYTNPRAHHLKQVSIQHRSDDDFKFRRDWIARSLSGQRILHARHLDAIGGRMEEVTVIFLGPSHDITQRLDAVSARWQEGAWILENGVSRLFDGQGQVAEFTTYRTYTVPCKEAPRDFIRTKKEDELLLSTPLRELSAQISQLKEMGSDPRTEEVSWHLKIAFPFANFILALLGVGIPFVFPTGQRAIVWTAIGFVITLVTGFFYIGFIAVGSSFGKNGTLPPVVSVWVANAVFGAIGVWMISKAKS